jgi:hypothetical protein
MYTVRLSRTLIECSRVRGGVGTPKVVKTTILPSVRIQGKLETCWKDYLD